MIKHIIMWNLYDEAEGFSKAENAIRIKLALEELPEQIPEIVKLEVGVNISNSDIAYDIVLSSEFVSRDDLKIYREHPDHIALVDLIKNLRSERHVVDYVV